MIFGKIWAAFKAQLNKLANLFWTADPIAQMQYEYDLAVEQLKEGRVGLEQYRALVDRIGRQVATHKARAQELEGKVRAFLQAGQREAAAECALQLQRAQKDLGEAEAQLKMHEDSYNNNVEKVKHATHKLAQIKEKIAKYDAELKLSKAEAEMAKLAQDFNFDVTTDFGQIEDVLQDKIGLNRAKARVAADLSGQGMEQIKQEQALEKAQAEMALQQFEVQMGLRTPETAKVAEETKELGPAAKQTTTQS
jgi:phage shock protein A